MVRTNVRKTRGRFRAPVLGPAFVASCAASLLVGGASSSSALAQSNTCPVTFSITNNTDPLSALQFSLSFGGAPAGGIDESSCVLAFASDGITDPNVNNIAKTATVAFADSTPTAAEMDGAKAVVTCDFVASSGGTPLSAHFNPVTVDDASEGSPVPTPAVPFPTMSAAVGACTPTAPVCGNGIAESGEGCDDGVETTNCDDDCTLPACGDGNLNEADGEECDDGNVADGDGCNPTCQFDCGDGLADPGEQCDDGNETNGDGCSTRCADTGDCPATPRAACVSGAASSLSFKDDRKNPASNVKDQGKWGVKKVASAIADGLIGDPQGGATIYKFCVYDAVGLLLGADIGPEDGSVDGTGWKCKLTAGKESCQYKSKDGNPFGISSVKVKAGAAGKGQASVQGKTKLGTFASPTMPLAEPVRAQLLVDTGSDLCFDAQFPTADKNDGVKGQYKGKNP